MELRTRRGRLFYGCTNFNRDDPEAGCQFTSWKRPIQPICPTCNEGTLVMKSKKQVELRSLRKCARP